MAKRKRYDDKFRSTAVVTLEAAGYPEKDGALTSTAKHLGVPYQTLRRWFHAEQNPPPTELVREKRGLLSDLLRTEIDAILGDMPNARDGANYRDLGVVLGILIDKHQLVTGKPTERNEINDTSLTDEQRANRIAAILDKARARRTGQLDSDGTS